MKNLQKIIFCIVILLNVVSLKNYAQKVPEWKWAKSAGGLLDDQPNSIATDSSGNIYVTGIFKSLSITFGTTTIYNKSQSYSDGNSDDIFIVKYDPMGTVLWAQSAGGRKNDRAHSIAIDRGGNSYITGWFYDSTITFGTTTLINSRNEGQELFIVKFDPVGNVVWAKNPTTLGRSSYGNSISIDNDGNIYIMGSVEGALKIDTTIIDNGIPASSSDMFVVKLNSSGNLLWGKAIGLSGNTMGSGIITDNTGNVYVTGSASKGVRFDDNELLVAKGGYDVFIAKYNSDGKLLWAKMPGGTNDDLADAITTDNKGNVFVSGRFYGTSVTFGQHTVSGSGSIFTVKYTPNGNELWAKAAGERDIESTSMITDNNGNLYISGFYSDSSFNFGSLSLLNPYFGNRFSDIFIIKYSPDGNELWGESIGGTYRDEGVAITKDRDENIFLTGYYWFSPITFGTHSLKNNGYADMFVAKLGTGITSIENSHNESSQIKLFPNPTASQFHISNLEPGNWTITIYTLDGQSVFKKDITESNSTIDLSGKAKGAYVYRLLKDGEVFKSGKILVE